MSQHAYAAGTLSRGRSLERRERSGVRRPLLFAALCVVGIAVVWVLAELVPVLHRQDAVLLHHFVVHDSGHVDGVSERLTHLLNPLLFIVWGIALVLVALARSRPRTALAIALLMGLAPLTSELLKPLLAHSHVRIGSTQLGAASYPSGHSSAAAILAVCAVLAAAPRWRPAVAAIGVVFSLAVGASLLIRAWHMPSDVLGGYLVALMWGALAVAALRASARRWPSSGKRRSD
jgi:membrane-associated phospholipid phosphatase